ncbi:LysM peptidoglycan-binding domain-containing protein [Paenisporosarcina sp. OV554]|uniref:LysM peptidoglycan-binding domain-containing protein n=1 Tax=Paenisporosarcina sp. OV554 TaxID=2135694 RepID=UPI000D3D4270|nr:LysM peptidoglycan-binding domain-containing protein [Paenisporosarcina sp. OV554]PUB12315.1 prepilin-type N-terminal cleavage/methylation domain-containing protein [Paenisporosarcina sp. OV554]
MKISAPLSRQNGLSLVEVLAALVLLGIVFVGIMTVFPQMTLFNERTDAKLDTMNLARLEMQHLQGLPIKLNDNSTISTIYSASNYKNVLIDAFPVAPAVATHKKIKFTSNGYDFEILINLTREHLSDIEKNMKLDSVKVKRGDTLFSISQKFYGSRSGERKIKRANGLLSNKVMTYQTLYIPK